MDPVPGEPTYFQALRTIAKREGATEKWILKWSETTSDEKLSGMLRWIAVREGEHSIIFRKRVQELTGELIPESGGNDGRVSDAMEIVSSSDLTDKEKFERMGIGNPKDPNGPRTDTAHASPHNIFDKKDIDPVTGELLGRYIAEERDTGKHLGAYYAALCEKAEKEQFASEKVAAATSPDFQRLVKMRDEGCLTSEEFEVAKALIAKTAAASPAAKL